MKIRITPTTKGKTTRYKFAIIGGNNKPVAHSVGIYASRRNARDAAREIANYQLEIEIGECPSKTMSSPT